MQQAGQVPYLDQNAHEQSLGQSDGSLPGPEQTLNQSSNQALKIVNRLNKFLLDNVVAWGPLEHVLQIVPTVRIPCRFEDTNTLLTNRLLLAAWQS